MELRNLESLRLALEAFSVRSMPARAPVVHYVEGDRVVFHPAKGAPRKGEVRFDFEHRQGFLLILLANDPYPVYLEEQQIAKEGITVTTKTKAPAKRKPTSRTKRKVETASEEIDRKLAATKPRTAKAPVKKARKPAATAKKAPAARKTAKAVAPARKAPVAAVAPLDNPFRPQSNSWHFTELLKKGGRRSAIVRSAMKKITVAPWTGEEYENIEQQIDKRVTMIAKQLENAYGWTVERVGRGTESKVKATPPSRRKAAAKPKAEVSETPAKAKRPVKKATKRTATKKKRAA